jgi:hypothetical protein
MRKSCAVPVLRLRYRRIRAKETLSVNETEIKEFNMQHFFAFCNAAEAVNVH